MKTLAASPAFPCVETHLLKFSRDGMTYRQWLAGHIMAGFAADPDYDFSGLGASAKTAVAWADALIAALEAPPDKVEMTPQEILDTEG